MQFPPSSSSAERLESAAASPDLPVPSASPAAVQRVIQIRRDYNNWVAQETMEDYALRLSLIHI